MALVYVLTPLGSSGGGGGGGGVPDDNSVTSVKIVDGAIATVDIGNLQVTSAKLAAGAVTAGKIAAGGVSAADQIAAGVVDSVAIANGAVLAAHIAAGAVGASEIATTASPRMGGLGIGVAVVNAGSIKMATFVPLALGEIGMDAATGRLQLFVGGSAKAVKVAGDGPDAHGTTHVSGGSDVIRDATAAQNGLMTAAYATKLDAIASSADLTLAGAGLTKTGSTIDVIAGVSGGITVAADSISVDQAFAPTWTATHIFSNTAAINLSGAAPVLAATASDQSLSLKGNTLAASNLVDVRTDTQTTKTAGNLFGCRNFGTNRFLVPYYGGITIPQGVATTGIAQLLVLTGGAHTGQTASTENNVVDVNQASLQWATGAIATQRCIRFRPTDLRFTGASTVSDASTVSIDGPPTAGSNATITRAYSLNVDTGTTRLGGALIWDSALSPAQITANQNDYVPTSAAAFAAVATLRLGVDATPRTVTGIAGGVAGRRLIVCNIETGATNTISFTNEDAASAAGNRFITPGGVTQVLGPGECWMLMYDGVSSRWRFLSPTV